MHLLHALFDYRALSENLRKQLEVLKPDDRGLNLVLEAFPV